MYLLHTKPYENVHHFRTEVFNEYSCLAFIYGMFLMTDFVNKGY
jgi:hypothetical protein